MRAHVAVGPIVYAIDGLVAYRVLTAVPSAGDRAVASTALVVMMVLNAPWNHAYFEYRSTLVGFSEAALRAPDGVCLRRGCGVDAPCLHALRAGMRPPAVLRDLAPLPKPVDGQRPGAHSTSCNPVISTRFTPGRAEISPSIS